MAPRQSTRFQSKKRKALPKISQKDLGNNSVAAMVMQGLEEDMVREKINNIILIPNYIKQDPISGWVSTGSFLLDAAIGFPRGLGVPFPAVIELLGTESGCKSSVLYRIMANMQQAFNGWAYLVDVETMFDTDYGNLANLDMSEGMFGYAQAHRLEDVIKLVAFTIKRNFALDPSMPLCIGVDSLAGCTNIAEQDTDSSKDTARALHARIMAKSLRAEIVDQLYVQVRDEEGTKILAGRPLLVVFVNQLKSTASSTPGEKKYESFGGLALKYHSRVRIEVNRIRKFKDDPDGQPVGIRVSAEIIKSKVGKPYRTVEFDFRFETGIEDYIPVMEYMDKKKAIEKSGDRYVWNDKKYLKNAFREFLRDNEKEWDRLKQQCLEVMKVDWGDKHSLAKIVDKTKSRKLSLQVVDEEVEDDDE